MSEDLSKLFDAAKNIGEELVKLPQEDRIKVIRWVAESLGISPQVVDPSTGRSDIQAVSALAEASPSGVTHVTPTGSHRASDIKSFLAQKQPKSDNQYATAVAYYYRFEAPEHQRSETISAETLQEAARLSGRARLGNPGSTLNNAMAQGYLDRKDPGQYAISTVGENLVAMTLPGSPDSSAPVRKKKVKQKAAKKTAKKAAKKAIRNKK